MSPQCDVSSAVSERTSESYHCGFEPSIHKTKVTAICWIAQAMLFTGVLLSYYLSCVKRPFKFRQHLGGGAGGGRASL